MSLLPFLLFALVASITPGPTNLLTVSYTHLTLPTICSV